jgi:plastocyanin domain-containing protein
MTATDWVVVVGGIAAIVWVNWYFFLAERSAAVAIPGASAAGGSSAVPEVKVTVHGGYDPATIRVAAGRPVRLIFDRQETSSCSEEIVFPDFGIRRFLPTGAKTTIEVTPPKPGRYEFACGMGMLHGALVAEEQGK